MQIIVKYNMKKRQNGNLRNNKEFLSLIRKRIKKHLNLITIRLENLKIVCM